MEARLLEVSESAKKGDKAVLEKIFALNNEIGWAYRNFASLEQGLFEFQTNVNLITMNVKRGEWSRAREALEASSRAFEDMKAAYLAPKKDL